VGNRCIEIREYRSKEAVSKDIKMFGPGEEIEFALFISMTTGLQRDTSDREASSVFTEGHDYIVIWLCVSA
jgi:hypothetical protein